VNNFLNTAASDISRARTVGLNQLTPEPFPILMVGTRSTQRFFFAERGTLEDWSGDATYGLRVTVGNVIAPPKGSTFTLAVGSGDPFTLPFDLDGAGLQNALNDDATIVTDGGVDVSYQGLGRFLIAYRAVGIPSAIVADAALLFPDCTAEVTTLTAGDATTRQLVMLTLRSNTPAQSTSWNVIASPYAGWEGTIDLTSAAAYELLRLNGAPTTDGLLQCPTVLTVEVIDASGNSFAYYQTPITLRGLNYMDTSTLAVGPTRNAQATSAAGTVTVTPASQIHTERITVTGAAVARDITVATTGLVAGARIDIECILTGATDGTRIRIYAVSTAGTLLFEFTRSDGEPNALFSMYYNGAGGFDRKLATVPAFYPT
jgi:hypothetical protein